MHIKQKTNVRHLLSSPWTAVFLGMFFLGIVWLAVGESSRKMRFEREAVVLQQAIQEAEQKNRELEQMFSVIASSEYAEIEAKGKLGMKKEGEKVFALNANAEDPVHQPVSENSSRSRFRNWFDFLGFGK